MGQRGQRREKERKGEEGILDRRERERKVKERKRSRGKERES